jgi:HK97 family phage prohead protease
MTFTPRFYFYAMPTSPRDRARYAAAIAAQRCFFGLAAPFLWTSTPDEHGVCLRFEPGAFDYVIRSKQPVTLRFAHSPRVQFASTADGTLTLESQPGGLHCRFTLPRTPDGDDALLSIERGVIVGLSVSIIASPGGERHVTEQGRPVQIVSHVGELLEISLADNPRFSQTYVRRAGTRYNSVSRTGDDDRINRFLDTFR